MSLESFRSFGVPLFRKPVTGQELFAVSYSKPALVSLPVHNKFRCSTSFSKKNNSYISSGEMFFDWLKTVEGRKYVPQMGSN